VRLACRNIGVEFSGTTGNVTALEGLSFEVREREFLSIVGPTGCGKTTILKVLAGLRAPTSGFVERIPEPGDHRPESALVFQEHALFPWMTIVENVAFGLEARGVPRRERIARSRQMLESLALAAFAGAYPHQLSVGVRQMAALGRALLVDPQVLLLDEPFASVDFQTRLLLREELLRIWGGSRRTLVFVTHDLEEAVVLSDRVLVLTGRPGRLRDEVRIPLPRPRRLEDAGRAEAEAIKWRLWRCLEEDARLGMSETR